MRRGFTIAEAVVGVLLTAGLLVSALRVAAIQKKSREHHADRIRAAGLAHDLMAEITQQPYSDPDDELELFGRGIGEILGSRPTYDDVDDYDGHSETPPKDAKGVAMPGYSAWTRAVKVERITRGGAVSLTDTGLKRITITVSKNSIALATLIAVRTEAWDGRSDDDSGLLGGLLGADGDGGDSNASLEGIIHGVLGIGGSK